MDPVTSLTALSSAASSAGVSSMSQANLAVQPGGVGGTPAFQLPEAPSPVVESGGFQTAQVGELAQVGGAEPTSYGHMLQQMVRQVNDMQQTAGSKVRDVLMGGPTTINDAMVSVEESGVSFKLLSQVRNKLVDSYQEIMRMQV